MGKLKLFFTFIVFLASLSSCMDWEDRRVLSDIRSLKQEYPDSALFLLDVAFHPRQMSDKFVAEWCMLNGDLRDSLKKDMEIDTAYLRRAVLYYKKKELPGMEAKAGLYLGRACVEAGDNNHAITIYKEALESASIAKDYNLAGYISSYLADLYEEEWNHEESSKLYGQAANLFLKAANIRSYGIALRDRGKAFVMESEYKQASKLYLIADSIACALNDTLFIASMANYKGILYLEIGKYDLAEKSLLKSIELDSLNEYLDYLNLCKIYVSLNKPEQVKYYLSKCPSDKDVYTAASYWNQKYELFKMMNKNDSALQSLENYLCFYDSIWNMQDHMYFSEISKKYDYTKMEDRTIKLSRQVTISLVGVLFLVLIVLLSYFRYRWKMIQKDRELERGNLLLAMEKQEKQKKEIELAEKNLESRRQRLLLKEHDLLSQKKDLELQQQKDDFEYLKKKEELAKQNLFRRSLLFKKIQMLSELRTSDPEVFRTEVEKLLDIHGLSEEDWREIKNEMNYVYPGFTTALAEKLPKLTEEEIRFCCLLKAGLSTSELATLLNINPTSVDRRRTRINKKIQELHPDLTWRDFL